MRAAHHSWKAQKAGGSPVAQPVRIPLGALHDRRFQHLGQFTASPETGQSSSPRSLKAFSNSCRIGTA
jgi:hypothetical protein